MQTRTIPWLQAESPAWAKAIIARVQTRQTGANVESEKPLPPLGAIYGRMKRERGASGKPDYTRTGGLMRSIQPKITIKEGRIILSIGAYGPIPRRSKVVAKKKVPKADPPHLYLRYITEQGLADATIVARGSHINKDGRYWVTGKVRGRTGRVLAGSGQYLRRQHTVRTKHGSVTRKAAWAGLPKMWVATKPRPLSQVSGAWWWWSAYGWIHNAEIRRRNIELAKARGEKAMAEHREKELTGYNQLAARLGTRVAPGQYVPRRVNPWLQFHPQLWAAIRKGFDTSVLAKLAQEIFK
jgi:hypothetical protein